MKKIIIVIIASVFMLSACMDEFLDVQPVSDLSTEKFWKTTEDVRTELNSAYGFIQTAYNQGYGSWYEGRTENWAPLVSANTLGTTFNMLTNQMSASDWTNWYKIISVANYGLYYIPKTPIADKIVKNHYIAEAYFLRAFAYFNIARIWGDAPLVTKPTLKVDDIQYPFKSTQKLVLEQVRRDIDSAFYKADINGTRTGTNPSILNKGKFTVGSLYALATDFSMWMHEYDKAISYSDSARFEINNVKMKLNATADYSKLFTPTDASSQTENIWVLQWDYINQNNTINQAVWQFMNPTSPTYTFSSWFYSGSGSYKAELLPSFNKKALMGWMFDVYFKGDKRKAVTLDTVAGGSSSATQYVIASAVSKTIWKSNGGVKAITANQANNYPVVMYRYADILLLRAEAFNRLGRIDSSLAYLKKVRVRAGLVNTKVKINEYVAGNGIDQNRMVTDYVADGPNGMSNQLEMDILKERSIELLGEGKRWFDLMRTGRAMAIMNDYYDYALSITSTIKLNKYTDEKQLYWPVYYRNELNNSNLDSTIVVPNP
jgi:hypothetical protein